MLFILGSVLAGIMLYNHFADNKVSDSYSAETDEKKSCVCDGVMSDTSVIYCIKRGDGELSLPPCKLMSVKLGPSTNTNKATLHVMTVDKSVKKEYKPVKGIDKKSEYVELIPIQYHTNIILGVKEKSVVPITAVYST